MKKIIGILVAVAVILIGYWLISPLFVDKVVDEAVEDVSLGEEVLVLSQGSFEGLANHNSSGTASLIQIGDKRYVRFEDDFSVTNGPDLFVHFGKDGKYVAEARLGVLKGSQGGQNYEIPPDLDPSAYNEVWVWCRAFSVPFAKAVLM